MTENRFKNNIVTGATNALFSQDSECGTVANMGTDDFDFNHNVFAHSSWFFDIGSQVTLATFISSYGQGSSQWNDVNCLYTNTAGNNFTLQAGSPCRSGGANQGVDYLDLDGDSQTSDPITLGAYITGNEVIGINAGGNSDITPPASPTNLTVI